MDFIPANAICLTCGTTKANPENLFCINDHDNWIEVEDETRFPGLFKKAMRTFGVNSDGLLDAIKNGTDLTPIPAPEKKPIDPESPKVVIYLDGGLVQWVIHNVPNLVVTVLDGDTEGADEDELTTLPFRDGEADVYCNAGGEGTFDPEFVNTLVSQIPHYPTNDE